MVEEPCSESEAQGPWDQSLQWEVFEYVLEPLRTQQFPRATTDPVAYRAFHVDTPGGQEAQTFRTRVRDFLDQHPTERLRQG